MTMNEYLLGLTVIGLANVVSQKCVVLRNGYCDFFDTVLYIYRNYIFEIVDVLILGWSHVQALRCIALHAVSHVL